MPPIHNDILTELYNHGPQPLSDLPRRPKAGERINEDIKRFDLTTGPGTRDASGDKGQTETVFYINGKHAPKTVIQTWLDVNGPITMSDRAAHWKISGEYSDDFKQASRDIFGPFQNNGGGDQGAGGTCPLCGEEYTRQLPDHLPCDA